MSNDTETRLQVIESEMSMLRTQLASIADNTKRIMDAVAGPVDGSRAGLAEHCRDYGARLAKLEDQPASATSPTSTTRRDIAIAGGAGGGVAFIMQIVDWFINAWPHK